VLSLISAHPSGSKALKIRKLFFAEHKKSS